MTGWTFACVDWEQRLREGRSLVPDLPLFKDKADRAVRIFDKLCVPDIEGQPPFAVAAGEWFRDIVRVIFGSLDDEGVRHVPEVFALVGKKNSKTTSGAGLMVTALLMNEVPWAEFLFIGPTQEIADLAFQQAAGMVEADPDGYLAKRFHVVDHKKTIRDRRNRAFVKVNGPSDIQRRAIVGLHLDLCRAVSSEQGAVGFSSPGGAKLRDNPGSRGGRKTIPGGQGISPESSRQDRVRGSIGAWKRWNGL